MDEQPIIETKAPLGYELDSKPLRFEVSEWVNFLTLTKYNTLIDENKPIPNDKEPLEPEDSDDQADSPSYLPETGEIKNNLFIFGSLMLVFSLFLLVNKKFKNN